MDMRGPIRTSLWLLISLIATYVLAEITQAALFTWLGIVISVWLFLNLYWLGICFLGYRSEQENDGVDIPSVEPTASLLKSASASPERETPSEQFQPLQQTTSE